MENDQDLELENMPDEEAPTYSFVEEKEKESKQSGKKKRKKRADPEKTAAEQRARRRAEKREAEKRARRERIGSIIITAGVILILAVIVLLIRGRGKNKAAAESRGTGSVQTVQEAGNGSAGETAGAVSAENGNTANGAGQSVS